METLVQRLVANPHDEQALAYAHQAGTQDPRSYAALLEKVGMLSADPAYAAHWLSEAANVWSVTIGDAHHAARTLMSAIEKDATQRVAADRLSQLYREKGDQKALVALLEKLVKLLAGPAQQRQDVRDHLASVHAELGQLWSEPPLSRPERSVENYRRLLELDPQNIPGIIALRDVLTAQEQYAEALGLFGAEHALIDDPSRRLALLREESAVRIQAGDGAGATEVLRNACSYYPDDLGLRQEVELLVIRRVEAGEEVASSDCEQSAGFFVSLAEQYPGEHGFAYSTTALRASPGHDRAMQLADFYGKQLGRSAELQGAYAAYLKANPSGFLAAEAREQLGASSAQPAAHIAPPASASASEPVEELAPEPEPEPVVAASAADLARLLAEAQADAQKARKPQALAKYREVLAVDPSNSEAMAWVEEYLRQKRMYSDLRDVLLAAARVSTLPAETRKAQLRDVAGLCESQLRDVDTAIIAWKQITQIDRGDEQARDQLRRLLEKGSRWDDLALLLEQDAMSVPDVEQKIALEKKLASLHEAKRKDLVAAAESWSRIAGLSPDDESPIQTAVKLFEKANKLDLAAQAIAENISTITDEPSRGALLQKLGDLRLKLEDPAGAGEVYAEAAQVMGQAKLWEAAEKAYVAAENFAEAANAVERRAELSDGKSQASLYALAADLLLKAGDGPAAAEKLERAAELDPHNDVYAQSLEELYRAQERPSDLITFLLARAEQLRDKPRRIAGRRAASTLQRELGDRDGARESLLLLLADGDDADALNLLIDDASDRADHAETAQLLRRLGAITADRGEKLALALREAQVVADGLDEVDGAIERYEAIVKSLDPTSRVALRAIADLEERRDNPKNAASALERELKLIDGEGGSAERVEIAQRLAQLYEGPLDDARGAIAALEVIHAAEPEDFDAIARLLKLCEDAGDWQRVVSLSALLIEVEGDDEEASVMTRRLAEIQNDQLGKGDEALKTLERLADQGDALCQEAYIELGDKLGWSGIVATKIVAWNETSAGPERNEALRGAFDRFLAIGREEDACRVAVELARSRETSTDLASQLEQIATKLKNLDALSVAHDLLARELSGADRAVEMVRQAEVLAGAGVESLEAMQHGESALTSVPPDEVEPLLVRLASLAQAPGHVIDLYERQVGRCRAPSDRLAALARAAQVAVDQGANDRARSFFELALGGGVQEDTIVALEQAASGGDERSGGVGLRSILAEALAAGGQGSRDGGRTRSALLRRAASIAERDLNDPERAFAWLGDAIITHVDDASLDALEGLGRSSNNMSRVEATLGRALDEVFDGPLVRILLARRAKLRREAGDKAGASVDLKKLHDLSPSDADVMGELSSLLLELGDHRGMIQLYEDQILRGRDPAARAELARKVAHIWEEDLGDAREAADAWRRVLRMKAGDAEATGGLERAKAGKLKRPPPPPTVPGASTASAAFAAALVKDEAAVASSSPPPVQAQQAPSFEDPETADQTHTSLDETMSDAGPQPEEPHFAPTVGLAPAPIADPFTGPTTEDTAAYDHLDEETYTGEIAPDTDRPADPTEPAMPPPFPPLPSAPPGMPPALAPQPPEYAAQYAPPPLPPEEPAHAPPSGIPAYLMPSEPPPPLVDHGPRADESAELIDDDAIEDVDDAELLDDDSTAS